MKRAIALVSFALLVISCKREEEASQATTITTATASAAAKASAGPTQLVALTQPVDSAAAPAPTLTQTQTLTQTPSPTPSQSAPPAKVASVVVGNVSANGLPAASVKSVVQKNVAKYRQCYDAGLRESPALAGRVTMRITIDASGAIASAEDAGSDLPDSTVTSCVFGTLGTLVFPQPEAGSATATVPIIFSPPS